MTAIKRLHDVDLNLLMALDALLAEGNVTRAAKRLGLTQPAMSHALKRLRDVLGDPLFVRTPRGVVPTARAASLQAPLARILGDVRALLSESAFEPATTTRQFTIATPDVGQLILLPPLLELLREQAPGVRVVSMPRPADYLERLASGELDLLLGGERKLPPQLRKQALLESKPVLVARADHPGVKGNLSLEQLAALPHIKLGFRDGLGGPLDEAMRTRGLVPQFHLTMNDLVTAVFVVARTDLVLVAGDVAARQLVAALPVRMTPIKVDAGLAISQIWHERQHEDAGHVWFRRLVREAVTRAVSAGA
jgi:DNA-binding transcriptional LysR family regulator